MTVAPPDLAVQLERGEESFLVPPLFAEPALAF
jgi:hypothetical protein